MTEDTRLLLADLLARVTSIPRPQLRGMPPDEIKRIARAVAQGHTVFIDCTFDNGAVDYTMGGQVVLRAGNASEGFQCGDIEMDQNGGPPL